MDTQSGNRPPVVWIVATVAVAIYATVLWYQLGATQGSLQQAQAREARLLEQLQSLAMMPRDGQQAAAGDGARDALRVALLRRPDLVDHEPVLGGRFYFLEDSVRVLSDRYAYAAFEDGHIMGHALIEYDHAVDGGVTLRVVHSYVQN